MWRVWLLVIVLAAPRARVDGLPSLVHVDARPATSVHVSHTLLGRNDSAARLARAWFADRFDARAHANAPVTLWQVVDGNGDALPIGLRVQTAQRDWQAAWIEIDDAALCVRQTEQLRPCHTFVDSAGESLVGNTATTPLDYRVVSSRVGFREHPLRKTEHFHRGTDYVAAMGTPVVSIMGGVVETVDRSWRAGRFVVVAHDDGTAAKYFHLSRQDVAEGQRVERGTQVGTLGNTGRVTGAHLHYELRDVTGALIDTPAYRRDGAARDHRWGITVRERMQSLLSDMR
jgi:murein DD-endopeptidase MepM/ murein hydrolase activator NlpD